LLRGRPWGRHSNAREELGTTMDTVDATRRIGDGTRVRVDAAAGTVTYL
jgi:hypothetical protein